MIWIAIIWIIWWNKYVPFLKLNYVKYKNDHLCVCVCECVCVCVKSPARCDCVCERCGCVFVCCGVWGMVLTVCDVNVCCVWGMVWLCVCDVDVCGVFVCVVCEAWCDCVCDVDVCGVLVRVMVCGVWWLCALWMCVMVCTVLCVCSIVCAVVDLGPQVGGWLGATRGCWVAALAAHSRRVKWGSRLCSLRGWARALGTVVPWRWFKWESESS